MRSILALKRLTLSQVSHKSKQLYGRTSPYFIPHNLYYDLRGGTFRPSIYQLLALSRITGYRIADWVRVFGADLEDAVRLQLRLPANATVLLDVSLTDPYSRVRWVEDRVDSISVPRVVPLGQLLKFSGYRPIHSLSERKPNGFLYAKIGHQDALAFPDLVPGSIVRINPQFAAQLLPRTGAPSSRYFLIEHSRGLTCCRLRVIGEGVLVPVSTELSYPQVELHPQEARLLGLADLEIRPWSRLETPIVPAQFGRQWRPRPLSGETTMGPLIRHARAVMHLSLREASIVSQKVSNLVGHESYFISPSSLCDYELSNSAPRRVETIITLCSLYGLELRGVLKALGINLGDAGQEPIPDHLLSREAHANPTDEVSSTKDHAGFTAQLLERFQEVPFFLRGSLASLAGLDEISLEDFFWIGGQEEILHPYLVHGLLAIVNRRRRRPVHFASKPWFLQPVYVLLRRDGSYMCACCGVEDGSLVVHPYSRDFHRADVFRYRQDVDVVGQIVAIARKLV